MVGVLALSLFLATSAPPAKPDVAVRLAAIENRVGGRLGVAALDSSSGRRIEFRPNERFPMCSTFKILAVAAVLERVDAGKEQLDRFVPYKERVLLAYAPVTKEHLKEGGMKLSDLCAAALQLSDNTAANLLLHTLGGPSGLTSFIRTLGDKKSRLDRMEPELNSAIPGDERDTTTPAAMSNDLRRLLIGNVLSVASRDRLEKWMAGNQTGDATIRAGVPQTWRVGDKTGRGQRNATNDIAVLHPPNSKPIFLAIYSVGSNASLQQRQAAIAEVAEIVAEAFRPHGAGGQVNSDH
ncbi:MAG: class A beta-lactamase [Chthoniobacterales bacterium]